MRVLFISKSIHDVSGADIIMWMRTFIFLYAYRKITRNKWA